MIVQRIPCPVKKGRLITLALDGGRRSIEMGDLFGVIPAMPFTPVMSLAPKRWVHRRQFVPLTVARKWLKDLDNKQLDQQHNELEALLDWAETTLIPGGDHREPVPA